MNRPLLSALAVVALGGVADGTVHNGVAAIAVVTGTADDKIQIDGDLANDLDLAPSLSTSDDKLDVALKSLARSVTLAAAPQGSAGNDTVKIVLDQGVPATVTTSVAVVLDTGTDTAEVVLKGAGLTHVLSGFVSAGTDNDAVKLELEGNAAGSLLVNASTGDDSAELVVKGAYTGSVQLLGSTGNDSLKVLVDGPFAGGAVIDGSTGSDSCSGPAGAFIRNCE
jgi:hypothetical protein